MFGIKWPRGPVYLLVILILLVLVPDRWEGPVVYRISSDHSISILDSIAMVPMFFLLIWIQKGIWKRRIYLFNRVTLYPGAAVLMVFSMGLGLGMLLSSAFFTFRYWWAIGGLVFIIMLMAVILVSGKSPEN
jgi:hypothetical protein